MAKPSRIRIPLLLDYMVPVLTTLAASTMFTILLTPENPSIKIREPPIVQSLLTSVVFSAIGFLLTLGIWWLNTRGLNIEAKIIMVSLTTPVLGVAFLLVSQAVITAVWRHLTDRLAAVLILTTIYITLILELLLIADIPGKRLKNIILLAYGSIFSAAFGIRLPLVTVITICILLSVFDILFIRLYGQVIVSKPGHKMPQISYSGRWVEFGIGEILFYSLPSSACLYKAGLSYGFLSVLLVVVGTAINMYLLSRRRVIPGLSIPLTLGCIPLVASITIYS